MLTRTLAAKREWANPIQSVFRDSTRCKHLRDESVKKKSRCPVSPFRNQHLLDGAFVSRTNLMELCHSLLYCKSGSWAKSYPRRHELR